MRSVALLVAMLVALPAGIAGARTLFPPAKEIQFAGHTWIAQSGTGPPGPNSWSADNAFVDANGDLHLKLTYSKGHWYAAEVYTKDLVGFGHYAFQVRGAIGALDPRVMFDLYNYGTSDYVDEVDVEFGRYGRSWVLPGHYVVYPNEPGTIQQSLNFSVPAGVTTSTHTMDWSSSQVVFRSVDDATGSTIANWTFAPANATRLIPQDPARFHVNLWLWQGRAPADKQAVEMVVHAIEMP